MSEEIQQQPVEQPVEQPVTTLSPGEAEKALDSLRERTYAGRNPQLGKMIKCQTCGRRHRVSQQLITPSKEGPVTGYIACVQKFAKDAEGNECSLARMQQTRRTVLGAAFFAKKRHNPHPNKRALLFVELVRFLTPDEYTQEDLSKARAKAKRVLAEKYGRHGFLPPIWQKEKKNADGNKAEDLQLA
jgi:hypothetical protein